MGDSNLYSKQWYMDIPTASECAKTYRFLRGSSIWPNSSLEVNRSFPSLKVGSGDETRFRMMVFIIIPSRVLNSKFADLAYEQLVLHVTHFRLRPVLQYVAIALAMH